MAKRRLGRSLSQKALDKILKAEHWSIDQDLINALKPSRFTIYRHIDGRMISALPNLGGRLLEAHEVGQYELMLRETHARMQSGPHHILEDSLPDGRDFPARVDDLLAALPALLNLTPTDLDYSAESLRKIERKLKRLGFDKCLQPPIFPAVVAYLGEMMRRQIPNSTWKTRLHEDGKTWEPWVVDPQGRVCNPWMDLYDDLAEGPMSLGNIPYSRAASRQLPPPGFWEQVERKG